jgi:hypothetical protein
MFAIFCAIGWTSDMARTGASVEDDPEATFALNNFDLKIMVCSPMAAASVRVIKTLISD